MFPSVNNSSGRAIALPIPGCVHQGKCAPHMLPDLLRLVVMLESFAMELANTATSRDTDWFTNIRCRHCAAMMSCADSIDCAPFFLLFLLAFVVFFFPACV